MVKRISILIVLISAFAGWATIAEAQSGHYSSASIGMGGTGTAYVDGYHANFVNPGNLMLNRESKPSMTVGILGGVSAFTGGPLMNVSVYNDYFTGGQTVQAQEALDAWFGSDPGNARRMGLELNVVPVGVSWRGENYAASLALRSRGLYSGSANRGYAEVMLAGISVDRFSDPKPVNFSSEAVLFSEISAGFSAKVLELPTLPGLGKNVRLYAGISPKYIIPQYSSGINFNSTLRVTDSQIIHDFDYTFQTVGQLTSQFQDYYEASQSSDFRADIGDFVEPDAANFSEVQGSGWGVDLGGTLEMDLAGPLKQAFSWIKGPKKLRVGLSILDLGSISYNNNAGEFSNRGTFNWEGVKDIEDGFSQALTDSISKEIYLNYQPGNKSTITKSLPTRMQLGSYLQVGKLSVALDLVKGFNDVGMNSKRLAMGIGAEYKLLSIIPLRVGYQTGGLTSSRITAGLGLELRNFEFTVGGMSVPNSQNRGSGAGAVWSGLLFRF